MDNDLFCAFHPKRVTVPSFPLVLTWPLIRSARFMPVGSAARLFRIVESVMLSIKRRSNPLIELRDAGRYREFVQYGFGRWKPSLKLAFENIFTYKQWKRLAHDLEFPLNATPTELSLQQWSGLYQGFNCTRRQDK